MLDLAIKYETELKMKFADIMMDEEYKYLFIASYRDEIEIARSTWNKHQFVSLNSNGEVVGFFQYSIDRETLAATGFMAVNFKKNSLCRVFGEDLERVINDIFRKFNFSKLRFGVVVGNPAEKFYDKYIDEIGGRIVGTYKNECLLLDNRIYDYKEYEVLTDDF